MSWRRSPRWGAWISTLRGRARRQGRGHELGIVDLVGQEDEPGGRLVVVELGDERAENLGGLHRLVGLGEIGPVAPVLPVAEEEHLDAELARLLVEGEDVRLLDRMGVDALHALDGGERRQPVAGPGGALELHVLRGLLHLGGDARLHRVRLARQERPRLPGEARVLVEGDLTGAGTGAALDLEEKARTGAVLVVAVVARAEQEGPLQGVHGAVHRPDAGEGAVIIARTLAGAAMLDELGRLVIGGQQDVGERLVVPEQHVVAGPQLLDEVGLEQQRLGLRRRGDELHRGRLADHAGDAVRMGLAARVGADAGLQALGLAHVEHVALAIEHAVDAGGVGQGRPEPPDDLRAPLDGAGIGLEVELDVGSPLDRHGLVVVLVVQNVRRNVIIGVATHGD